MNEAATTLAAAQAGSLPGLLGFDWIDARTGVGTGCLDITLHQMPPMDFCTPPAPGRIIRA